MSNIDLGASLQPRSGGAFAFSDEELGRLQAMDSLHLPVNQSASVGDSYWQELIPSLTLSRQWLIIMNIIACCCVLVDETNLAMGQLTGISQNPWTSIVLNMICDVLWLASGVIIIFDIEPDKYPFAGLDRRQPLINVTDIENGPSEEVVRGYQDYLYDIEAKIARRFGQEFALVERRLQELERCTPRIDMNGNLVDRQSSSIPEHTVVVPHSDLDSSLPGMPWKLEDHLASLGARLHEIELAFSEVGDSSDHTPKSASGDFALGDDLGHSLGSSSVEQYEHLGDSEHLQMEEFERQELERMELRRLEGEELKMMEELENAMMELEQPRVPPCETNGNEHSPSSSMQLESEPWTRTVSFSDPWSSISSESSMPENFENEHSDTDEELTMGSDGTEKRFAPTLSIIPLSGRVSELEVLVAKIVSQLCTCSALSEKLKDNLRTMTHQALSRCLPAQRNFVLQGAGKDNKLQPIGGQIHRVHSRRAGRAGPLKFLPGKTLVGRTSRPTTAGALRYRRNVLNVPYGRQHGVLPLGRQHSKLFTGSGSDARLAGTPGQPTRDSQGRL